jgi:hypothetical protein
MDSSTIPENTPSVLLKPRKQNSWQKDCKPLIAKVTTNENIRQSVDPLSY